MKNDFFPYFLLLILVNLSFYDSSAQAEGNSKISLEIANSQPLVPADYMIHETKWLLGALEQAHFEKVSLKELDATTFIEEYLSNLDKRKLFFTANDLTKYFKRYKHTLLTYLEQGNLFPGFEVYGDYREKSLKRMDWVLDFLTQCPNVENNGTLEILEPDDQTWFVSDNQLDDYWEKLITHEYINEILSQIDENESLSQTVESLDELKNTALERLKKKYQRWTKNISELEATDVQEIYLSTLTQQFDPHTSFLNIKEKEKFDQTMQNEFVGIGAVLTDEDGFCTIKELLPGGPAEASRELEPEDIIMKVAQGEGEFVDVVDMRLSKIVELIKGPKDTVVRLKIRPINAPSTSKTVKIIRDRIKLTANLASATVHESVDGDKMVKIGVIDLPSFYGSNEKGHKATDDVEELLGYLKSESIEGLILDLRKNGGGYLSEAVNLAGLFISRGPVVQVKSTDGKIRKKFDFNPKLEWDGPLLLLVSRYSASASEIVAGALKNHRRAIIVGDRATHGKGTVQSLLPMDLPFLPNHPSGKKSAAKITIQKYYLPSGESTQLSGVKSDITMDSVNELLPIGEADLKNALSWDKIESVNFRRPSTEFRYDGEDVEILRAKSLERQSRNKEFLYLQDNISWFKEKRNQILASLNLNERINLKHSDNNRSKQLKNDFEELSDETFPEKEVHLRIVREQQERSLAVRGESDDTNSDLPKFQKPENMDIRLHESLRIMYDWINLLENNQISRKEEPNSKRI